MVEEESGGGAFESSSLCELWLTQASKKKGRGFKEAPARR
jgi:hypothetical protein